MKPSGRVAALLAAILLGFAPRLESAPAQDCRTVRVVDHGYHTGIVLAARDFDPEGALGTNAFRDAVWLEIGWGDAEFYQARNPSLAMAISALFGSEESVLHVLGIVAEPETVFPGARVIALNVPAAGYDRLIRQLRQAFVRGPDGAVISTGSSFGGRGRFFRAEGSYSLAYTCNNWMADILVDAGVPIDPTGTSLSSDLMDKLGEAERGPCHARPG